MPTFGPRAVVCRRIGLGLVLTGCVVATVLARHDGDTLVSAWLAFVFYLAFCAEPMRRVLRDARVPALLFGTVVLTSLLCLGIVFCLPVTNYGGAHERTASVLSLSAGVADLSAQARGSFSDATWMLVALLAVATLALWYQILRLARSTRWRAIDHVSGDAAMQTGATLPAPLGTGVTRPAGSRVPPRR